jgi:LuxR family maltose regulon positive regulatory protein
VSEREKRVERPRLTTPPLIVEAKLRIPPAPEPLVERVRLLSALEAADRLGRVHITGPAGAGKTTLLGEWCRRRQLDAIVAWVNVDERDSDPVRFWEHVLESAERSSPNLGTEARDALRAGSSLETVTALFLRDLGLAEGTVIIALDDFDRLGSSRARESVDAMSTHLPPGVVLAIASRRGLEGREHRLVLHGRAIHVSADSLRFDATEAARLIEGIGHESVTALVVDEAQQATGGWAVPLRLLAQHLIDGREEAGLRGLRGELLVDYLYAEVLDSLSQDELDALGLLVHLDRFNRPLVTEVVPSGATLLNPGRREELGIRSLGGGWYTIHELVREAFLRHHGVRPKHQRLPAAGRWHADHGFTEEAIALAVAAGDWDTAAELLNAAWPEYVAMGRSETLRTLLEFFPAQIAVADDRIVITAAWVAGFDHDLTERDRLLGLVDSRSSGGQLPDGTESVHHAAALNRALIPGDYQSLISNAHLALELTPERSPWRGFALMGVGTAHLAEGDHFTCRAAYLEAMAYTEPLFQAATCGGASLAAALEGDLSEALELAERAEQIRENAGFQRVEWLVMHEIARGLVALRRGSPNDAVAYLTRAEAGVAGMIEPYPHIVCLVGLAEAHHALGERMAAASAVECAEKRSDAAEDVGDYFESLIAEARQLFAAERPVAHAIAIEPLTEREETVLRLLATTRLSQTEIAENLYISRNTVKTHTSSIYRKLRVTSRGRAAERASRLGLI